MAWVRVEIVGGCVCRLVFKFFVCLLSLIFRFAVSLISSWCSGYCSLYLIRGFNRLKKNRGGVVDNAHFIYMDLID